MKILYRISIIFSCLFLIATVLYFPRWKAQIVPQKAKTLDIFTWGDILDMKLIGEFEKKTGIKINLSFYTSNEELKVKMRATKGEGYDLVMPSDYTVSTLVKEGLLQLIDHSQIEFWDTIYPVLLDHRFDPGNRYSIPFEWEIFGFGIDSEFFDDRLKPNTWRAIFDPHFIDYQIAMKNDPIEVFQFASYYLFGPLQSVSDTQFKAIRELLIEQRKWIVAYSDFRADYYIATGNTPLAMSTTSYIKRIQQTFPNIRFVIPKEGSFVSIENFCIPETSKKQKEIYTFLNYLYRPESLIQHQKTFLYLSASDKILGEIDLDNEYRKLYEMTPETFKKYQFFQNIAPQQQVQDLWIEVKSF
jgi:spermidine/putrescine transport system substrate-binding protein